MKRAFYSAAAWLLERNDRILWLLAALIGVLCALKVVPPVHP